MNFEKLELKYYIENEILAINQINQKDVLA